MSIPQTGGKVIENKDELVEYFVSGFKTASNWRIGTEHEKFGYFRESLLPINYENGIEPILNQIADQHDWARVLESGKLIGLEKNGANVSLEPGGQLELSGAPVESIFETCDEVRDHLDIVRGVADPMGIDFIGLGAAPIWNFEDMPRMPKGRYKLMTDYMDRVGSMGKVMMYRTTTVQVNLDFSSEADMIQKFRTSLALQPIATALFASSPFFEGKINGYRSFRSRVWQDTDKARTGMIPFVFEEDFSIERYVDYALDVPMYFVYRDGKYVNALGQSFRDFLKGELPALPGEKPLLSDWADHLTTLFPEVRIKKFMEMRGADGGPWSKICALPAFWVGLLYDETSLNAAWDLVKNWDAEFRQQLRLDAAKHGIHANLGGQSLAVFAKEILALSQAGLKRRAIASKNGKHTDESFFLNPLREVLEKGETQADEILRKFENEWSGDPTRIYDEYRY